MKLFRLLILLGMFICSQSGRAQVLGYPGATWLFQSPQFFGMCFEVDEKWEYTGDTVILGTSAKEIHLTQKVANWFPPTFYTTYYQNKYFHVNGDTAWLFVSFDSTWQEVYNFSVQIGDTVQNPLGNRMNGWASSCPDSVPYNDIAVVTNTGLTTIDGQSLKFYTLHYYTGHDTSYADQTFIERVISLGYWFPNDEYWCGAIPECINPTLICYKDNGMMTDSSCSDLTWFDHLSIQEEGEGALVKIFPNPTLHHLFVEEPYINDGKYMIISLDGRQIRGWMQSPLNVAPLEPGIYFLVNEARTWAKKFVKN